MHYITESVKVNPQTEPKCLKIKEKVGNKLLGQVQDGAAQIEVRTITSVPKSPAEAVPVTLVYVTKYLNGQIGERSVGMSAEAARAVAALLLA